MTTLERVVSGETTPEFSAVTEVFEQHAAEVGRGGAAFAVLRDGKPVVDLWSGRGRDEASWEAGTVGAYYSATKGLTAACVALLHSRGRLDVDAPMQAYWPEFAAEVSVRQVLSHTAGIIDIPGHEEFMQLEGPGYDNHPEIRRRLATAQPAWEPGSGHGYHVLTFGYLAGTLVELVDGRPLRQFFAEEFVGPLGLDLQIGPPAEIARLASLFDADPLPGDLQAMLDAMLAPSRDPATLAGRACNAHNGKGALDDLAARASSVGLLSCGGGFGDGTGTARALAAFYGALLDGSAGVSAATIAEFSTPQSTGRDKILGTESVFCLGFQGNAPLPDGGMSCGPNTEAFGHGGAGGQLGFADPVTGLTFGFVRSHLSFGSPLLRQLVAATYACL